MSIRTCTVRSTVVLFGVGFRCQYIRTSLVEPSEVTEARHTQKN